MSAIIIPHPSSYRDPSGYIFEKGEVLYRQVNLSFKESFDHFIKSGCYQHLVSRGLLVPHEEIRQDLTGDPDFYTTLKPEKVPFISYPYEWSFDMLKDAALLTLQLVRETLQFGIILKDATPYNIQWMNGRLTFIDTLSFDTYTETPWIAYRQFCENFLGPLLLMHYSKQPLQHLSLAWPDGIPVAIIQSLLPKKTKFSLHIYLHIHLHAKMAKRKNANPSRPVVFKQQKLLNLISSLETLIQKLKPPVRQSVWSGYYTEASQRNDYLEQKQKIINNWVAGLRSVKTAADLGANEGVFSKLLAAKDIQTVATDFDPICINTLYNEIKKTGIKNIQPLVLDLANPSPAIGMNNEEHSSLSARLDADLLLVLAVIHHLSITKNIPFHRVADLLQKSCRHLIIEFVPLNDEKAQQLASQKPGVYADYTVDNFETAFTRYFTIDKKEMIGSSGRTLYLMTNNQNNH